MRISISLADEFKEWVLGKWSFPPEIRMKDYDHPAMFPEELPRRLMKLFSYKNDIVLDPFNGAGTTSSSHGNCTGALSELMSQNSTAIWHCSDLSLHPKMVQFLHENTLCQR